MYSAPGVHRVSVMREPLTTFPELYLEVFVVGDAYEQKAFADMFIRAKCQKAKSPLTADLVIFTGGEDVDPVLYGESPHSTTSWDVDRDNADMAIYQMCVDNGIPMFGVCRGAQFLHVMHGGKLYQHIDNHNGDHSMWDRRSNSLIKRVSSVHHQCCIENRNGGMEVIADSNVASVRWRNPTDKTVGPLADVEAFFYRSTCSFGVQGHPEYKGYNEFMRWTLNKLDELVNQNPDLTLINNYRRIKTDLLEQRASGFGEVCDELKELI